MAQGSPGKNAPSIHLISSDTGNLMVNQLGHLRTSQDSLDDNPFNVTMDNTDEDKSSVVEFKPTSTHFSKHLNEYQEATAKCHVKIA